MVQINLTGGDGPFLADLSYGQATVGSTQPEKSPFGAR